MFWSCLGNVLCPLYPLWRQLARSSRKTTYLHVCLRKPVWTPWPVAFPSFSKGIKNKSHILNLWIKHKLPTAGSIFFSLKSTSSFPLDVQYFLCVFSPVCLLFLFPLHIYLSSLMHHGHASMNRVSFWISLRLPRASCIEETNSHGALFRVVTGRYLDACRQQMGILRATTWSERRKQGALGLSGDDIICIYVL